MGNTNSNVVANIYTTPVTKTAVGQSGGRMRVVGGNFEIATADFTTAGDTIRLAFLPANARIWGIYMGGDTLDTGSSLVVDIGLYDPGTVSTAPGTVNDVNIFATALTTFQTATDPGATNFVAESQLDTFFANFGQRLFEIAGDTEGTFSQYEIVVTSSTPPGTDVAGTIAWWIEYTVD